MENIFLVNISCYNWVTNYNSFFDNDCVLKYYFLRKLKNDDEIAEEREYTGAKIFVFILNVCFRKKSKNIEDLKKIVTVTTSPPWLHWNNYCNALWLKRHWDGKVSSSDETNLRMFETSLPKKVEKEITNNMKIMNKMSKMFHRIISDAIRKFVFDVA